jgi:hypothetical protein
MRVMTRNGIATLGRTPAGKLRALVGRAGDPCCCDGGGAYKARECCDGEPAIWIRRLDAERCGGPGAVVIIRTGPDSPVEGVDGRCFTILNEFATDDELRRLGIDMYGGNAVECVGDCGAPPCPPCPDQCCIFATLPSCSLNPSPGSERCCVLGSAYAIEYLDEFEETRTGPVGFQAFSVIGGGCPRACVWAHDEVTDRRYRSVFGRVVWAAQNPLSGEWCSDVRNSAVRLSVRRDLVHVYDSLQVVGCEVQVRGLRAVPEDETVSDDVPVLQMGELPAFQIPPWLRGDEAGRHLCNFHDEIELCSIPAPEPCPNPDNPNQAITTRVVLDVRGSVSCDGGEQTIIREEWLWPCRPETFVGEPVIYTRREWRRRWTVRVLARDGCEILTCPGRRPAPSPQLVRQVSAGGRVSVGASAGVAGCGGCGRA